MALFDNRANSIIDPEVRKAQEKFLALMGHDVDEELLDTAFFESLAMPATADEVEETIPLEALIRQGNR